MEAASAPTRLASAALKYTLPVLVLGAVSGSFRACAPFGSSALGSTATASVSASPLAPEILSQVTVGCSQVGGGTECLQRASLTEADLRMQAVRDYGLIVSLNGVVAEAEARIGELEGTVVTERRVRAAAEADRDVLAEVNGKLLNDNGLLYEWGMEEQTGREAAEVRAEAAEKQGRTFGRQVAVQAATKAIAADACHQRNASRYRACRGDIEAAVDRATPDATSLAGSAPPASGLDGERVRGVVIVPGLYPTATAP